MSSLAQRIYSRLVPTSGEVRPSGGDETDRNVPVNGLRLISANALQNIGDQVVNAGTVLPWLLSALGAPVGLVGLLVPIRESGSLLPQAALSPRIRQRRQRKWVWVAGAGLQATAAFAMALVAATSSGVTAGVLILLALALFAFGRALCSISSKDVMARTIPKGQRGQITGISTLTSGIAAVTIGLAIRLLAGDGAGVPALALLLGAAALTWVAGLLIYMTVREPPAEIDSSEDSPGWLHESWQLLSSDAPFRRFVVMRTLLFVSALSPPFLVTLAVEQGTGGLSGLGLFVIAQGLARTIGGRYFGRLADRSSRRLMTWGALLAALLIAAVLLVDALTATGALLWFYGAGYFLLALIHTGVRVGRKTYVVDMASADQVTQYVAVSNTLMGVLLLLTGGVNAALALLGVEVALAFLAALGFVGYFVGRTLPEVGVRG